jgi:CRP/FNR family nitrogen fixation transcriptional regulator
VRDGRRQIAAFHFPNDAFGLELRAEHKLSAEAITDVTVVVFRRDAVIELTERDKEAAQGLWLMTARQLQEAQDRGLLLVKNAQERVAAFLLEMAARMPPGNAVNLPMSRQDIANYLGLTIETVSRTLTQLETDGIIDLPTSRRVILCNQSLLAHLNG